MVRLKTKATWPQTIPPVMTLIPTVVAKAKLRAFVLVFKKATRVRSTWPMTTREVLIRPHEVHPGLVLQFELENCRMFRPHNVILTLLLVLLNKHCARWDTTDPPSDHVVVMRKKMTSI